MHIRQALESDAAAIARIFNHAIETGIASWLPEPVSVSNRLNWIRTHAAFVAEEDGVVLGFAGFGPWKTSPAYRFTVEDSVYIGPEAAGKGVGFALMSTLIDVARSDGYRRMVASIEAGNEASIALHRKCGFEPIGIMPGVGEKWGRELDLSVWMKRLTDL
ncbi:N-acyltransferase YncA [Corynebacterium kalinowskii]|uniref:N-acyltransferase YncA n=1 Tax=Corynebacterium kalinowskii TaxID=2675216 RepID=A0A6B8VQJ6_9CORY|nr:GNAT family N-acetyltransferase [Corynebacterium kalinowskii]QGU01295.1 N-acyltransferase YncA [Corynebacterium kalinowskii]